MGLNKNSVLGYATLIMIFFITLVTFVVLRNQ